jgi:hypothetical protein
MDKKTKLYLGIGVVAVGAYLLFKSKKATPALTAAAPTPPPAKFVGMINELNSPTQKFNADGGKFASVGYNMRPMSGGMINTTDVVGARAGSQDSGIFASANGFASVGNNMRPMSGGMINTTDVVGARAGSQDSGIFASANGFASVGYNMRPMSGGMINTTDVVGARAGSQNSGIFANQPFTGDVANMVGANGEPVFANLFGSRRRKRSQLKGSVEIGPLERGEFVTADGTDCFVNQSGRFFDPRTARNGQNEGVFAPKMPKPKRTLPVEPSMPMPVTQPSTINNLVGQDGSRFFKVTDGAFVNR